MMSKIVLFSFICFLLLSCKQESQITLESRSFTEQSIGFCDNLECPKITINYVFALGNEKVSKKINSQIGQYINDILYLGDGNSQTKSMEVAARDFVQMYRLDSAEFPDMTAEYFAEINVSELYTSDNLLCLEMRQYLYTGGAHGSKSTVFLNLNPITGSSLAINEIVNDVSSFTSHIEMMFRSEFQIPDSHSINGDRFWFENETFSIPETIGFMGDKLILIYNPYEIASYADGPIELEIPLAEIEEFLIDKKF